MSNLQREQDLRLKRALSGLSPAESRDLVDLAGDRADGAPDSWERASAAAHLALLGKERSPVPSSLRDRLLAGARAALSSPPSETNPK